MQNTNTKIPEIRFPEFRGEWVEKRLGEICQFYKGKGISKNDIVNNEELKMENGKFYKCIRYGELYTTYAEIIKEVLNYTNYENPILSKVNDVLIPSSGETAEDISTASCILEDNVAIGGDINILRCKINGQFLSYYLRNKKKKDIAKLAQGVSIVHLYANNLKSLKLHIPPTLDEQKKIANFLSSVDEKIEIVSKKIEELKKYKKGMLQKFLDVKCNNGKCEPELRFKGFSGDWIEKRLGEIGETYSGLTNKNKEHFNQGNDYYIPFMNVMNNTIIDNSYLEKITIYSNEKQNKVKKGDILFTTSSETPNEVGMCSVYLGNKQVYLNSFCFGFRLMDKNINSLFLTYLLRYKRNIFYKIAQGATRYNLSKKHFNEIKIHLPPTLDEQQKIADFLSSIDEKIELNEKKLEKLKAYKQGLLQKMFI